MNDELLKRAETWVHDVRRTPLPLSASIDLVNALAARVRELEALRERVELLERLLHITK